MRRTAATRICIKLTTKFMVVNPHESSLRSFHSENQISVIQLVHDQKKKNLYFKKPWPIVAIAKANPYFPRTCGTFRGTVPVSPCNAPLETLPSNKARAADKDRLLKPTLEPEHRDLPKMTIMIFTVDASSGRISTPTLGTGVGLNAH